MLNDYNKKRNFEITTEPKGIVKKIKCKFSKFSVQEHHARNLHYDLRLENNGVLVSFAIPKKISNNPNIKRLAIKVEDHPLDYIFFEGVIPEGQYGAGSVMVWDKGNFTSLKNFDQSLKSGKIELIFNGEKLKGGYTLVKIEENNWLFFKSKDKFIETKQLKKTKNPFHKVDVKLALLTKNIPTGKDYIFEIKYDGYRIVAFIENGKVKLVSRNNNSYTSKFEIITNSLIKQFKNQSLVLDGEITVLDENGVSNFGKLQDNIKQNKNNFVYFVFDILALNGEDLRDKTLTIRKNLLKKVLKDTTPNIVFSDFIVGNGKKTFNMAKKLGLEGVVAKKIDSIYDGKRDENWLKIKCYNRQEFVIVGYTTTDKNEKLSAILLAYYKDQKLIFAGKVGTGFTIEKREELSRIFKKYISPKSYLDNKLNSKENIIYLKPKLLAEIQFIGITKDNLIRQGSFVDLRFDKQPKQVVLENIDE